jgi:hypothetical protein
MNVAIAPGAAPAVTGVATVASETSNASAATGAVTRRAPRTRLCVVTVCPLAIPPRLK